MNRVITFLFIVSCLLLCCTFESTKNDKSSELTAAEILGNPKYMAISYGGYREQSRNQQPSIPDLKEDLRLMSAMGIKILRTYNVQLPHAANILKAITELKEEDSDFKMYVMLGAWIDCKNAWKPGLEDHNNESEQNEAEIARAVALAQKFPSIVKVLAVGNEAMVKWAASYYVRPGIILKWVNHLQKLKKDGILSNDLWITSSDNFASWGGDSEDYHVDDLESLIHAVDYISMHTYPMHETHYFSDYWIQRKEEYELSDRGKVDAAMMRAIDRVKDQYQAVVSYAKAVGADKPVHIGETGWASNSDEFYGPSGSRACDEYKQGLYYMQMRKWTQSDSISCFFFEAFDEQWKDAEHPNGSENHFGLFTLNGKAKYAIWDLVDQGLFEDLERGRNKITKSFSGDLDQLIESVLVPPTEYNTN